MKDTHVFAAACGVALIAIVCVFTTSASAYKHPEKPPTPQETEAFARLKKIFPGKLLDKEKTP